MVGTRSCREGGVKLFVFDFDQTLSVGHVFKSLAGWVDSNSTKAFRVPAPFARTEVGQIRRIEELSEAEFAEEGGFARVAFGGAGRVEAVDSLLQGLRAQRAEVVVCTKGLVGPVRKCLLDLGLLDYFDEVYGNVGDNYGTTPYDRKLAEGPPPSAETKQLLGRQAQASWRAKDKLISVLMENRGLRHSQCVLIEDDPDEVRRADGVCRTLLVRDAAGVTSEDIGLLLRMAAEPPPKEPERPQPRVCTVQ